LLVPLFFFFWFVLSVSSSTASDYHFGIFKLFWDFLRSFSLSGSLLTLSIILYFDASIDLSFTFETSSLKAVMLFNSEIVCRFVADCTRSSNVNYVFIVLARWNTKPHLAPLYHIFLNPCKLFFLLTPLFCELSGEAPNTKIIVFGLIRPGAVHTIYNTREKARYPLLPLDSVIIRTKNPWIEYICYIHTVKAK